MAGAISLAYVDFDNQGLARQSALDVAVRNNVWGEVPSVTPGDVTFPSARRAPQGLGPLPVFASICFATRRGGTRCRRSSVSSSASRITASAPRRRRKRCLAIQPIASSRLRSQTGGRKRATMSHPQVGARTTLLSATTRKGTCCWSRRLVWARRRLHARFSRPWRGRLRPIIVLKSGGPNDAIAPGWYHPVVLSCVVATVIAMPSRHAIRESSSRARAGR
jgi:hypothetical protein